MSQTMSICEARGPIDGQSPQAQHMNVTTAHILPPHPHNNLHHMVPTNTMMPQKTSMTMDSQYMQQQSQIFVFNTLMANQAAEAVDSGQFASIIDFHCSNPETKSFLEKYPIKAQLNRNSPAQWLNSMAQKQGGRGIKANIANTGMHASMLNTPFGPRAPNPCVGACNMHNPSGPGPGGGTGRGGPGVWANNQNMCSNPNWSAQQQQQQQQQQQMFAQNSEMNASHKFPNSSMGTGPRACGPPFGANNNFQNNPQMFMNPGQGMPPRLAGLS